MGAIQSVLSAVYLGLGYCFMNAAGSLCNSCLGTTAAGTNGRKRSVLLLSIAIAFALFFQYKVGPSIVQEEGWVWKTYRAVPGMGKAVFHAWRDDYCERFAEQPDMLVVCAGNAGAFRPTALAFLFFAISAIGTRIVPAMNREAWLAKYVIFLFGLGFTCLIPNYPLFTGIFLWLARLGAMVFVVLQQIILIDMAYNWNDDWVEKSNECDRLSYGSGQKWLRFIVATCVLFYTLAVLIVGLLYQFFSGCPENNAVITLTLIGILAMTGIQLSGTEGSLLTSSAMCLYAAYLAFSIVSKNPNQTCNPNLGKNDVVGIVFGLFFTFLSLAWTGWSWSAEERLSIESAQAPRAMSPPSSTPNPDGLNLDVPFLDPEERPPAGLVMEPAATIRNGEHLWKLNVVLALISCWVAMILTGWGSIEGSDESQKVANPTVGRWNMAMLGVSQWLAIILYCWTLLAPRLFPNREFGY